MAGVVRCSSPINSGSGGPKTAIEEQKTSSRSVTRPGQADLLEQRPHAVQVDAVALFEVVLGLAGYHGRKVKDEVGPVRHQTRNGGAGREVGD